MKWITAYRAQELLGILLAGGLQGARTWGVANMRLRGWQGWLGREVQRVRGTMQGLAGVLCCPSHAVQPLPLLYC